MKTSIPVAVLALASQAVAFPAIAQEHAQRMATAQNKRQLPGFKPGFDAKKQYIDTTGAHKFVAPGPGDQRGPCPGLNALANHNYLPHNGVATIQQYIQSTNSIFGMGLDLSTFLAVYGAVFDGNLQSWSIAGPTNDVPLLGGLLGQPQGLSYSHNKYEGDASPTRGDLYQYGDASLVQLSQFKDLYAQQQAGPEANYNIDVLTGFRKKRFDQSKAQNPYFFNGPFSGVLVQPAAYTFIYRFMANKSAEHPEGFLSRDTLKSFFSITGPDDNLVYTPGNERIPDNWYRRAFGDEYTIPYFAVDVAAAAFQHPEFVSVGGNTGTVNSFTGLDPSNLTGGVFNIATLTQGNNAACFAFQSAQNLAPDFLKGLVNDVTAALSVITKITNDALSGLGCPNLAKFEPAPLAKFPGYTKLKSNGRY